MTYRKYNENTDVSINGKNAILPHLLKIIPHPSFFPERHFFLIFIYIQLVFI